MLRKGVVFKWAEQCNNAFNLLKSDLVKMPRLQYPNPNKTFQLFTNASKHNYSGILHQEEIPDGTNVVPNLVPIAYFFWAHSVKHNNCNYHPERMLWSLQIYSKDFVLFSRHRMHTILQSQTAGSIFHYWNVQSSTFPVSSGTTAVQHPIQAHLGQQEHHG